MQPKITPRPFQPSKSSQSLEELTSCSTIVTEYMELSVGSHRRGVFLPDHSRMSVRGVFPEYTGLCHRRIFFLHFLVIPLDQTWSLPSGSCLSSVKDLTNSQMTPWIPIHPHENFGFQDTSDRIHTFCALDIKGVAVGSKPYDVHALAWLSYKLDLALHGVSEDDSFFSFLSLAPQFYPRH